MSQRSLDTKFGEINRAVSAFSGHYAAASLLNQSGTSSDDVVNAALTLYQSDTGGPFKFLHCWRILSEQPKWSVYNEDVAGHKAKPTDVTRKRSVAVALEDDASEGTVKDQLISEKRPFGSRAAKAATAATKTQLKERGSPMEKLAAAVDAKARAIVSANDLAVMTAPLTGLTATARQYIELQQTAILNRAEAEDKLAKGGGAHKSGVVALCGDVPEHQSQEGVTTEPQQAVNDPMQEVTHEGLATQPLFQYPAAVDVDAAASSSTWTPDESESTSQ
eukprot:GHVU01086042.1.p1 GENE.GHVU01086042.1~~GHVU01086042.1.p1  ORF type:complete len:277 (-),score=38.62 GHVU01086042.1:1947-2777(-)